MKLLHTADWHLGQTFFEYDRKMEHSQFLTWLHKQITIHGVDVLLIAGDVFDSPNPSADSQKVFYTFIKEITAQKSDLQYLPTDYGWKKRLPKSHTTSPHPA